MIRPHPAAVVAVALALTTATACGVNDGARPPSSPTAPSTLRTAGAAAAPGRAGRLLTSAEIVGALPVQADLPGFALDPRAPLTTRGGETPEVDPRACRSLLAFDADAAPDTRATADFALNARRVAVGVAVASHRQLDPSVLQQAEDAVRECSSFGYRERGTDVQGSVQALPVPHLGDRAVAYRITQTVGATTVYDVVLACDVGHNRLTFLQRSVNFSEPATRLTTLAQTTLLRLSR